MGRSVSHATNSVYVEYSNIDDGQEFLMVISNGT